MSNIVAEHKGFKLEHHPSMGYRVWHHNSFEGDIIVGTEYKDNRNPEDPHYKLFIVLPNAMILTSREAKKIAKNVAEAQEAAEVFEHFLNS